MSSSSPPEEQSVFAGKEYIAHKCLFCNPIIETICDVSNPCAIFMLRRTCRALADAIDSYHKAKFNIDKLLESMGLQAGAFRAMQRRTSSLVGGSTAFAFFARRRLPKENINLYVQPGHCYEVARHLIDTQGFLFKLPGSTGSTEFIDGITDSSARSIEQGQRREAVHTLHALDGVHRFVKRLSAIREVEILTLQRNLAKLPAATLNLISDDLAVSLYPKATYEIGDNQELKWNMIDTPVEAMLGVAKYDNLGVTRSGWHSKSESRALFKTGAERRVGDKNCWTIQLDTTGLDERQSTTPTSPPVTRNLVLENSWHLIGSGTIFQMRYCVVSLPIFRYSYTVSNKAKVIAMRKFYEGQGSFERAARSIDTLHQTWWDGELRLIQRKRVSAQPYPSPVDSSYLGKGPSCATTAKGSLRDDGEETMSTISERSYLSILPVLVNARMNRKTTNEILHHFDKALRGDRAEFDNIWSE
ncbi:hypothetical protein HWV62_4862 [Athelia sp. TMB]|nr:hypothetical protein HWV62_4862 [Athelia sp. TMB]